MNNRPSTTTCRGAIFFLRQWSEAFWLQTSIRVPSATCPPSGISTPNVVNLLKKMGNFFSKAPDFCTKVHYFFVHTRIGFAITLGDDPAQARLTIHLAHLSTKQGIVVWIFFDKKELYKGGEQRKLQQANRITRSFSTNRT